MGKPRLTLEKVAQVCLEHGWTLLSVEYVNTSSLLDVMCEYGHISQKNLSHIKEGRGCKTCRGVNDRKDFEVVKEKAKLLGFTILSDLYVGVHSEMEVVCENGHHGKKTWNYIRRGRGCQECFFLSQKGEGSHSYRPDKPEELRVKQRSITNYKSWRISVLERDKYTCRCCEEVGGKLIAHHIFSYKENPDLRVDISNGITLCEKDHLEFHKIYGRKNNTQEQLDEFISMKKSNNK